jgi:hypothetical protein
MNQTIHSLPPALQGELEYTQSVCAELEVYPVDGGLFQLYHKGFPKKDPMTGTELTRWLDGFREGLLHKHHRHVPQLPSGVA